MLQKFSITIALRSARRPMIRTGKDKAVVQNFCHGGQEPATAFTAGGWPAGMGKAYRAVCKSLPLALLTALSIVTLPLWAKTTNKKLYCWEQDGRRICSDLLPADAVNHAREEFNAKSGMRSAKVQRAFNPDELATAADEAQRQADQAAEQTRRRTEQVMLLSYENEGELLRVFRERKDIIENNLQSVRFNVSNLRDGLLNLLNTASDHELDGRTVNADLASQIQQRHSQLLIQRQLQAGYEQQQVALEVEIETVIKRYRELKNG